MLHLSLCDSAYQKSGCGFLADTRLVSFLSSDFHQLIFSKFRPVRNSVNATECQLFDEKAISLRNSVPYHQTLIEHHPTPNMDHVSLRLKNFQGMLPFTFLLFAKIYLQVVFIKQKNGMKIRRMHKTIAQVTLI